MTDLDLNALKAKIRAVNLLLLEDSKAKAYLGFRIEDPASLSRSNVKALFRMDEKHLHALVDRQPRLQCWYKPILDIEVLLKFLANKPKTSQPLYFENRFEKEYWQLLAYVLKDGCKKAPSVLGISIKEANLVRHNLNAGTPIAHIADQACRGRYELRLNSLTKFQALDLHSWTADLFHYADQILAMEVK